MDHPQERRSALISGSLQSLLQRACRLLLLGRLAERGLRCLALVFVSLLATLALDAIFAFRTDGLIMLDGLFIGLCAGALVYLVNLTRKGRFDSRRMAVIAEQKLNISDSRLINAVDLTLAPGPGQSQQLRQFAIEQGEQLANDLAPGAVLDRRGLGQAAKITGIAILVIGLIYLLIPGVFHAGLPRLLDPTGHYPPFTFVKFHVEMDPLPAVYEQPVTIRARLSGPTRPAQATLVFVDESDQRQSLAMRREAEPGFDSVQDVSPATLASQSHAVSTPFMLKLDRAERSRDFFIDTPKGRSKRFRLEVVPVPQFERVTIDYSFPSYTGWLDVSEPLDPDGIRALKGTKVAITVASNVPLRAGKLQIPPDGGTGRDNTYIDLLPEPVDLQTVRGTFELNLSGYYELALVGADGTPSSEQLKGHVVSVPDAPPAVQITEPPPRVIVPEGWPVNVRIETSDDIGVDRLTLHRGINGWDPTPTDVHLTDETTFGSGAYRFDLEQLGAEADDIITYFATVYDNHSGSGQTAQTPTYAIQVISEQEYQDYARTQYRIEDLTEELADFEAALEHLRKQREQLLEELAELQAQLARGDPLTDEQQQRMKDLEAKLAQFAQQARSLAQAMQDRIEQFDLYEFEDAYKNMLKDLARQLEGQAKSASELARSMDEVLANDLPGLRKALGARGVRFAENDKPFCAQCQSKRRETRQDLEKYQMADAIIAQAERIRSVVEYQQDLAQRMDQFRHHRRLSGNQQRLANKLAEQQALIREELINAKQRLRLAAEDAQDVLPGMSGDAFGICDAIDELEIEQDQADAEQQANAGLGRAAYRLAQSAADKLNSLLSNCESVGQGGVGELCDSLNLPCYKVQSALQQLAQSRSLPGLGSQANSGIGFQGSMARMAVMGPAPMGTTGKESQAAGSQVGRFGHGGAGGQGGGGEDSAVENLTPAEASKRGRGAKGMLGVPLRFRDDADAYFYRLAEESKISHLGSRDALPERDGQK